MARLTLAALAAAAVLTQGASLQQAQKTKRSIEPNKLPATAQSTAKQCPFTDICYSLNLPNKVFTIGGGELFLQISGPDTYSWIGLGQGETMEGANMFIIYADGKGNVTLSSRLGTDMVEPLYNPDAQVELLAGSGVSGGRMVANMKCSNCDQWKGGSMDLKSDITMWVGAALPGPPIDSTNVEEHIEKHFVHAAFPWSMVSARGGDGTNPFVKQSHLAQTLGGVGTPMAIAHGTLACVAFLVFFPTGAIFVRFAKFPGLVYVHAGIQVAGYLVYIAAAGMGLHMMMTYPIKYRRWDLYTDPHPKIGMALMAYLFLQAISGGINHWLFGKKSKRLFSHWIHIWAGRAAILLGIINGGLGMQLGHVDYTGYKIAFGLVATVVGFLFMGNIIFATTHMDAPNPSLLHRGSKDESDAVGNGQGHVRMDSMEDRERLNAANADRTE